MNPNQTYLQYILSGVWLDGFLTWKSIKYILFVVFLTITYVSIIAKVEQKQREIKNLEVELQNKRSEYVSVKSAVFTSTLERELVKTSAKYELGLYLPKTQHRVISISTQEKKTSK